MNVIVEESFLTNRKLMIKQISIKEESKIALGSPSFHLAQERKPHSQGRKGIFPRLRFSCLRCT